MSGNASNKNSVLREIFLSKIFIAVFIIVIVISLGGVLFISFVVINKQNEVTHAEALLMSVNLTATAAVESFKSTATPTQAVVATSVYFYPTYTPTPQVYNYGDLADWYPEAIVSMGARTCLYQNDFLVDSLEAEHHYWAVEGKVSLKIVKDGKTKWFILFTNYADPKQPCLYLDHTE